MWIFSRIETDVKEIKKLQKEQNETLLKHEMNLAEHMRRTDLLEKRLDSIWSKALTATSLVSGLVTVIKLVLR